MSCTQSPRAVLRPWGKVCSGGWSGLDVAAGSSQTTAQKGDFQGSSS